MTRKEKYSIPIPTEGSFNNESAFEYVRTMNPKSRELLNLLIWFKAKHKYVCPRQDTLARILKISRMQVSRIIKKLVEDGVVGKVYRHQKSCYYNLNFLLFTHKDREIISGYLTNLYYLKYDTRITTPSNRTHGKVPYIGLFLALSKKDVTQTILKETSFNFCLQKERRRIRVSKLNAREATVTPPKDKKPKTIRVRRRNITIESLGNVLMDVGLRIYSILGNSSDAISRLVADLKKYSTREKKKPIDVVVETVQPVIKRHDLPFGLHEQVKSVTKHHELPLGSSELVHSPYGSISREDIEAAKQRVFNSLPPDVRRCNRSNDDRPRMTLDRIDISQFDPAEIKAAKDRVCNKIPDDWKRTHLILQQLGFEP